MQEFINEEYLTAIGIVRYVVVNEFLMQEFLLNVIVMQVNVSLSAVYVSRHHAIAEITFSSTLQREFLPYNNR